MKRLAVSALAALTFAAPLAISTNAAADPPRHERRGDRDYDRRGDRGDRYDRDYDNRDDRRDERQAYREGRRDGRQQARWDDRRYNGYWSGNQFYYGPPPPSYREARYEYRQWRRGDRLPSHYRNRYREVDYRRHHLRAPPRGYHYVQDDRGDYLLLGIATGAILGVILANN